MASAKITGLYRYPVKSMMGEVLANIDLAEQGIPGDRAWAVRDEERGGIRGAKRFASLMTCRARYDRSPNAESIPAEVTLPSGECFLTVDDDAAGKLSELVGSPVTIWPLMPVDQLDHYRRGAPVSDDFEQEMRRIFARLPDEPLPDLSVFPPELMEFESPVGTYFDAFPLLVMTQQSLDSLQHLAPSQTWDVRRFRPNILLDCPDQGDFPEQNWEGKTLRLGTAVLKLEVICPRCVMTTHGFDDLAGDPGIMRSMVNHTGGNLGIYASIVEPGHAEIGAEATLE